LPTVVVVGAGALTLGLITPTIANGGHDVIIATRVDTSLERERIVAIKRRGQLVIATLGVAAFDVVPIKRILDITRETDRQALADLINTPSVDVIVTAARDGFDDVADCIVSAAAGRSDSLLIVCADNRPPRRWEALRSSSPPGVEAVASIADRICIRFPRTHPTADVLVEPYSMWTIEDDPRSRLRTIFAGAADVAFTPDIESATRRKLHLVNGLQLALALLAWLEGQPLLHLWIQQNGPLAEEVAIAIADAYRGVFGGSLDDNRNVTSQNLSRFRDTPDRTGRILGLSEGQSAGDSLDLQERVAVRLSPLLEHVPPPALRHVVRKAKDVVAAWQSEQR
jgi:hypothetical protein